jgi:hypothetical protein
MDKDRLRVQHSCLVHEIFCTLSRDGHFWPLLRVHEKYETHIFYNTSATEDPSWLKPSRHGLFATAGCACTPSAL